MNNTNAYQDPLPFFEGEQVYFNSIGYRHVAGKRGSRERRESRVDVWTFTYPALPAEIRMTVQRPKLLNAPWEIYGCMTHTATGTSDNLFLSMTRYADDFAATNPHIREIVATLRDKGRIYLEDKE